MRIGIDGDFNAFFYSMDAVAPIQIQTVRIGVQFQRLAVNGCRINNILDINRIGLRDKSRRPVGCASMVVKGLARVF